MEQSRKVSFEPLSPRDHRPSPDRAEAVLAYKSSSTALLKKASPLGRGQLEKHLKTSEKDASPSFSVRYSEGGRSDYLIIEKGLSTFNLHTTLRKIYSSLLESAEIESIVLDLQLLDVTDSRRVLEAFASLTLLAPWKPELFGRKAKDVKPLPELRCQVLSKLPPKETRAICERGAALGSAMNLVRTLADLPANILTPAEYRRRITALAQSRGMKFEYWDTRDLKKKNAGAFLAVVRADPDTASGIAHLTLPAKTKKPRKKIALVGKGLCFDTGGYNVKTGDHMSGMHRDMTGSAVALATACLLAELHPDLEVHAYLALAENLISPTAYKPDEVVVASNGISIEVINTDAEGRMVLSDTLALASQGAPDVMLDFATLTGSAIRSLDTRRSAVFSNRSQLAQLAVRCGDSSGERTWSFPIGDDYKEPLKSKVADIKQCIEGYNSDHIYAATFLAEFVAENVPWVHMDLAATENKGGLGLVATDTTGFGVRWALEFIESFAK